MTSFLKPFYRAILTIPSRLIFIIDRLLSSFVVFLIRIKGRKSHQYSKTENIEHRIMLCGFRHRRPKDCESVEATTMFATFAQTKFVTTSQAFFYDDHYLVSLHWLFRILIYKPTYIVLSSYNPHSRKSPSLGALIFARGSGSKLIFFWWDTCSKNFYVTNSNLINLAWRNVVIDNPQRIFFPDSTDWKKFLFLHTPVDVQSTTQSISLRKNNVFFQGSNTEYRSNRNHYIEELLKIPELNQDQISTNQELTYSQYREAMNSAKICVSFPESVDCDQLKARVLEAMGSGALLLDRQNTQTSSFYDPGVDYLSFQNATDLKRLVEKIIENPIPYSKIAKNGYQKTKYLCNPNYFWNKIFTSEELD